jgi:16S rRNA (cytosine967-C5)-methyltransferase
VPPDGPSRGQRSRSKGVRVGRSVEPPAGYDARQLSVELVSAVLSRRRALDEALADTIGPGGPYSGLVARDRGFARLIAATVLRRLGRIQAVIDSFLERPLPKDRGALTPILLVATAQLLFLGTPAHAVINVAVAQCRRDREAQRFASLANAVLRRVSQTGPSLLAGFDESLDTPVWLMARWEQAYGPELARRIAIASLREAPLDLTVGHDARAWAERLGGQLLPTGSVRLAEAGRVEDLAGYADGAWWVQDAAAALPARLMGLVTGLRVADLCAAPGGKTAQLAAAGARVTAVDVSSQRLDLLAKNLARLDLSAEIVCADATTWMTAAPFDTVLLDVPCLSTGTIRRHPDILHLKRPADLGKLTSIQARLTENAVRLLRPGGTLVYCCCSLEPEEGPQQIARLLDEMPALTRRPISAVELGMTADAITAQGDLRTFPFHLPAEQPEHGGMDGFYAARLTLGA